MMRSLPWGAVAAIVFVGAAAAQQREATPRLLLGRRVLRADDLALERELPGAARHAVISGHHADGAWAGDGTVVDLAAGAMFVFVGDAVQMHALDGAVRWSSPPLPRVDFAPEALAAAVLGPHDLVLRAAAGGLVAVDRTNGHPAWHVDVGANTLLAADRELVFAGGAGASGGELRAHSLENGARAFAVDLPAPPLQVVPAAFGVAVRTAAATLLFDRAGPRLGELPAPAMSVVAGTDGWFVLAEHNVTACGRDGAVRWTVTREQDHFDTDVLAVDAAGRLLIGRFCAIADSGMAVTCLEANDGAVRWTAVVPGLGVSHSKYSHRAQLLVFGDLAYVVSQASGGEFVQALWTADGALGPRYQSTR